MSNNRQGATMYLGFTIGASVLALVQSLLVQ